MLYYLNESIKLSSEQYSFLKKLRTEAPCHSYRKICRLFTRKYTSFLKDNNLVYLADKENQLSKYSKYLTENELNSYTDWETGNQMLGMDLCFLAMDFFGESFNDGW